MPPTRWLEVRVSVPDASARTQVADALLELGASAVEESDDTLITHFAPPPDTERFLRAAEARIRASLPEGAEASFASRWRKDVDWQRRWRASLRPRRVGRRFVVTPPRLRPEQDGARDIVLIIDPGTAFGTGEHATTRGMLRLLERAVRAGDRVLDVGAGSAILGIAAARLGAAGVLGVESDADALSNARANVARNHVEDRIELRHASVDAAWLDAYSPAGVDLILANVLSGVIVPLLPAFRRAVGPGGRILVGGILADEADRVLAAADDAGLRPVAEDREDEWWTGWLEPDVD